MQKRKTDNLEDETIEKLLNDNLQIGSRLTMGEQMEYLIEENKKLRLLAKKLYIEKKELENTKPKKNWFGIILIIIGVIILLALGCNEFKNYRKAQKIKQLQEQKTSAVINGDEIDMTEMLPEYREIYKTNSDLVGWIVIDGTNINYPVVQNKENQEYYLSHDFDGEEDNSGSIFVDARNDVFAPDDNIIIHGHNMKDGSVFGYLQYYLDKEYYEKHKIISFDTLYSRNTYEIVAVGLSKISDENEDTFKYYNFLNAKNNRDFNKYKKNIQKLAAYDTGVDIEYGDKLITLSTCNSFEKDGRLFIVAKMKENLLSN